MSRTTTRSRGTGDEAAQGAEITTFPNAVRYLYRRADYERNRAVSVDIKDFKLERMAAILDKLGNPHEDFRSIHIAGTVGKGSVTAMLASMLQACGYVVGEFTSPHLVDVRERVQINHQPISRNMFIEQLAEIAEATASLDFEPTFFELITALAFKHFSEEAIDIAVVEVGLGGRLDCTNVITPQISIVTRIDFDHTHLLGGTLAEIAREKAGIFKRDVPALSVEQPEEAEAVLREAADAAGAPIEFVNKEIEFSWRFGATADRGPHTQVCLFSDSSRFEHVPVPLPGEHQAFNCGVALAAIDLLKRSFAYDLPDTQVHEGLAATDTSGRMQLVWSAPRVVIDGAHNPASLEALFRGLGAHMPYDSLVCVFGCCEDKDVYGMLERLGNGADKVIFTRARGIPRAADAEDLQRKYAERTGKMSQVAETLPEALNIASRAVGREDLICVTGSFYLAGETKKHLAEVQRKRRREQEQAAP